VALAASFDGDGDAAAVADALVRTLEGCPHDDEILEALELASTCLVDSDLIHRLVPYASRLLAIDFTGHPWAALPSAVAICASERARGRQLLRAARERFVATGDPKGQGYACFLEGLEDLGEGKFDDAAAWWRQSRQLLDGTAPLDSFAMAHAALGAFSRGALREAIVIAEESLSIAQIRGDARLESICAMYLALIRFWTGNFRSSEMAASLARDAMERIEEPANRYEEPMVYVEIAALAAVRGDFPSATDAFDRSMALTEERMNPWYAAITRVVRAELMADLDPVLATADARTAVAYFRPPDDDWLAHWAQQAFAVAHRATGNFTASLRTSQALLERDLNPVERGRALLCTGETHVRAGDPRAGMPILHEAAQILECAESRFWAAKAHMLLAAIDTRSTTFHLREARKIAGAELGDPAWHRLLRGPATLSIRLLGEMTVLVDGLPAQFKTRAEMELVAMLALAGERGVPALEIGERLWPDADWSAVSHRIDNAVSNVRRALLPATRLERRKGVLFLELADDECDVIRALIDARRMLDDPDCLDERSAETLLDRIRAPLLGGPFATWTTVEQTRIDRVADRIEACLARSS
jgi:hypothetical protein